MEEFWTNTALYSTLVSAIMAAFLAAYGHFKFRKSKQEKDSLESRLERLGASAAEASKLAKLINAEIESMKSAAVLATEEAKKAESIAGLSREQRDAVAGMIDGVFENRGRKDLIKQLLINFAFFVLGSIATPFIASLISS